MEMEKFIIYIAVAFVVGVVTGVFMIAAGSGISGVTHDEARRIDGLISKIGRYPNAVLTLWSNGTLIDSVTVGEKNW